MMGNSVILGATSRNSHKRGKRRVHAPPIHRQGGSSDGARAKPLPPRGGSRGASPEMDCPWQEGKGVLTDG
jgi:hypothetical protein